MWARYKNDDDDDDEIVANEVRAQVMRGRQDARPLMTTPNFACFIIAHSNVVERVCVCVHTYKLNTFTHCVSVCVCIIITAAAAAGQ